MNKLFAVILFFIGIGLVLVGACGNILLAQAGLLGGEPMNAWSIIWRILLGIILIALAVVLNNLESVKSNDSDVW